MLSCRWWWANQMDWYSISLHWLFYKCCSKMYYLLIYILRLKELLNLSICSHKTQITIHLSTLMISTLGSNSNRTMSSPSLSMRIVEDCFLCSLLEESIICLLLLFLEKHNINYQLSHYPTTLFSNKQTCITWIIEIHLVEYHCIQC